MSHWRTARLMSGAQPSAGPRYVQDTPHDSSSSDRDFAAFIFALFGLCCPFLIAGAFFGLWYAFS